MKYQTIYSRLRRVEGQIRGIEDMVAGDRSFVDILIQLEAAKSSLSSIISSLVDETFCKNEEGKVVLDESSAQTILRLIKKN